MTIKEQLEGLYFYSFTSGEYDCYSFDGMYVSSQYISDIAWDVHVEDYKKERNRLIGLVPTVFNVNPYGRQIVIRDMQSAEAKTYLDFIRDCDPAATFIAKYELVAIEETQDFHRD